MFVRLLGTAAVLALAATVQAGAWTSAIQRAKGANMTGFDESREVFIDSGFIPGVIDPGDSLVGFMRIDTTSPTPTDGGNATYIVFSQTFESVIASPGGLPGSTTYSGVFASTPAAAPGSLASLLPTNAAALGGFSPDAMLAVIDVPLNKGFSVDLTLADMSTSTGFGGIDSAITAILDAEGTVQATFGVSSLAGSTDFFAFRTSDLGGLSPLPDFVAGGIALTETVVTSLSLGNFGGGLSVIDNFQPNKVIYNRLIPSLFTNSLGTFGLGSLYDLAVVNGNFGGILENPITGALLQNADPGLNDISFVDNADVVINALVVPEPASACVWATLIAVGGVSARRRRKAA